MNTRIIDALGFIDEKFLDEALDTRNDNTQSKSRKPLFIGGACTIAAAVIAGVFISRSGIIGQSGEHYTSDYTSLSQTETTDSSNLPKKPPVSTPANTSGTSGTPANSEPEPGTTPETPLPYDEFTIDYDNLPFEYTVPNELTQITSGLAVGGMGFEGFQADDISDYAERNSHNPWNPDLDIKELPIFKTRYGSYATYVSATLDKDEAMARLEEIAAALGGELSNIELNEVKPDHYNPTYADELEGKLLSIRATVGNIDIYMSSLSSIQIVFNGALHLPDGYGIDREIFDSETQDKTARYIIDKYPELFGFENPTTYFDFYRCVYDYSDNAFDAILNYNFSQLRFYEHYYDDGVGLINGGVGLWINDVLADYECGGFYPVITPEKAREELLAGNYVTTVPDDPYLPDGVTEDNTEDYCELVYRMNSDRSAYIPYYKFIVRLHDEINDGNHYGVVLVPAIGREYLTDTVTDFNPKFN